MQKDPRPYIAVANELFTHPKFIGLTDAGKLWLIELWAWCNAHKTDGIVPKTWAMSKGKKVFDQLCSQGWIEPHDAHHVSMHDYLAHQKSKAELEELSAERSVAGRRGATIGNHRRWHVNRGVFDKSCEHCADLSSEPDRQP